MPRTEQDERARMTRDFERLSDLRILLRWYEVRFTTSAKSDAAITHLRRAVTRRLSTITAKVREERP